MTKHTLKPDSSLEAERYRQKLEREVAFYREMEEVHDLPPIFHYWSNKYIRPMVEEFGFTLAEDLYANYLALAAGNTSNGTPHFLSVGCGNCDTELRVAQRLRDRGLNEFVIDCLDLNADMLERGRRIAREAGMEHNFAFLEGDFNSWSASRNYDAVIANQALHHVVGLEHLFAEIHRCLLPTGYFITNDMIGQNGHQRWPEAMRLLQGFWRELPAGYRWNRAMGRYEETYLNHDCSNEGFEGIRAQDILPLLVDRFHFHMFVAFGNVVNVFVDRVFGHHFDANREWDREFIDRVHACDEAGFRARTLTPTQMYAVLTTAPSGEAMISRGLGPKDCLRGDRFRVTAAGSNLEIVTPSLRPVAENGVVFRQQLATSGVHRQILWSAEGLPAGLTLSETGLLSGRVFEAGLYTPVVSAQSRTNPAIQTRQRYTLSFEEGSVLPPPSLRLPVEIPTAIRGRYFRQEIPVAGGRPPHQWRIVKGRLPAGLELSQDTGWIAGNPRKTGRFPLTVGVTDAASESAEAPIAIVLRDPVPPVTLCLPQLAAGGGWKSSLRMLNRGPSEAGVSVRFLSDSGAPLAVPLVVEHEGDSLRAVESSVSETLPPYSQFTLHCGAIHQPGVVGWASLEVTGSVLVFASLENASGAKAVCPLLPSPRSVWVIPFRETGECRTGLAIANPNVAKPAPIRADAFTENGHLLGTFVLEIPPAGHSSFLLQDRLSLASQTWPVSMQPAGFLEIRHELGQPFFALGLLFEDSGLFSVSPTLAAE